MKHFNKVFDFFLYQSIFTLLLSVPLFFLDDPISSILMSIALVSVGIAIVLGCFGYYFQLFTKDRDQY